MLKAYKKTEIINEIISKMEWVKNKKYDEETAVYEDDPEYKEENEFVEEMQ